MSHTRIVKISVDHSDEIYKIKSDVSGFIVFHFGGEPGTLHYKNGKIKMMPMSYNICPKQICSKTGWIEDKRESIVCLPNRIIITIENNLNTDIDMITF